MNASFSQSLSQDDTLYAAFTDGRGTGTFARSSSGSRAGGGGGSNSSDSEEGGLEGSTESIEEYNHRRFSGHTLYVSVGKGTCTRTCLEVQLRID